MRILISYHFYDHLTSQNLAQRLNFDCLEMREDETFLPHFHASFLYPNYIYRNAFAVEIRGDDFNINKKKKFLGILQKKLYEKKNYYRSITECPFIEKAVQELVDEISKHFLELASEYYLGAGIGFFKQMNKNIPKAIPEDIMPMMIPKTKMLALTCKSARDEARERYNKKFDSNAEEYGKVARRMPGK